MLFCPKAISMKQLSAYQQTFLDYLSKQNYQKTPFGLYEPIDYIMHLDGKRLRPILVIMAAEAFGKNTEDVLPAALAIECFHNFSLVHDDIMDNASLRRGNPTVHEKWDVNTGILSGDAMLIQCYQYFEAYEDVLYAKLTKLFSKTAIEVCEGQQWDVEFENRDDVSMEEYLKMIENKTAVLVAAALQMGAIIANASKEDQASIYEFGRLLGIAFQIQDDYLDAFGDPATFGKKVGGDIIENKKTYLYLKAIELSNAENKAQLQHLFTIEATDGDSKIENVKYLFEACGAKEATQKEVENYSHQAFKNLEELHIPLDKKKHLLDFGIWLMNRKK